MDQVSPHVFDVTNYTVLSLWFTRQIYGSADEESDALIAKRKDTALKRFLQQCDSGNPRKRSRYNTPSVSS